MAAPRPPHTPSPPSAVQMPIAWIVGLAALVITPWIIVATLYFGPELAPEEPEVALPGGSRVEPGPWGDLILTPIVIAPPLEYIPADWGREGPPEWALPGIPTSQVPQALASFGMAPEDLTVLARYTQPALEIQGSVIRPPAELVRGLSPDVRAKLYPELAKSLANFDQAQSFRFLGQHPEDWLGGSLMSAETRRLVEPLIYRDGDFLHFADIEAVRPLITDPEERQLLAKALLRSSTVMMSLIVDSPEDVPAVSEYWGRGGRRTDIRPLLESMITRSGPHTIDIAHLLPAFPRSHLYRYPKINTGDMGRPLLANCLWSALNFFNQTPDDRYLDVSFALNALRTEYYIVEHGFQLGDIVALVDDEGDLFHTAVHLATGYVFTKNGTSPVAPWTIMTVDQLKAFYKNRSADPRLLYHRPNAY